jgi:hypothetical protein
LGAYEKKTILDEVVFILFSSYITAAPEKYFTRLLK